MKAIYIFVCLNVLVMNFVPFLTYIHFTYFVVLFFWGFFVVRFIVLRGNELLCKIFSTKKFLYLLSAFSRGSLFMLFKKCLIAEYFFFGRVAGICKYDCVGSSCFFVFAELS